MYSGFNFPI